jgi:hypothetical protein
MPYFYLHMLESHVCVTTSGFTYYFCLMIEGSTHSTALVITSLIFQVDWTKEVECFRTFMAETARFYRVATSEGASFSLTQHVEETTDNDDEWKYTIGTSAVCVADEI